MAAAQKAAIKDKSDAQVGVKEAKLLAKQAQEIEVLQGRGARGRDQLKRAHAQVWPSLLLISDPECNFSSGALICTA